MMGLRISRRAPCIGDEPKVFGSYTTAATQHTSAKDASYSFSGWANSNSHKKSHKLNQKTDGRFVQVNSASGHEHPSETIKSGAISSAYSPCWINGDPTISHMCSRHRRHHLRGLFYRSGRGLSWTWKLCALLFIYLKCACRTKILISGGYPVFVSTCQCQRGLLVMLTVLLHPSKKFDEVSSHLIGRIKEQKF